MFQVQLKKISRYFLIENFPSNLAEICLRPRLCQTGWTLQTCTPLSLMNSNYTKCSRNMHFHFHMPQTLALSQGWILNWCLMFCWMMCQEFGIPMWNSWISISLKKEFLDEQYWSPKQLPSCVFHGSSGSETPQYSGLSIAWWIPVEIHRGFSKSSSRLHTGFSFYSYK